MSRIKSPQEKKQTSLKRDRRNTYGENSKSSRKNIPRSKQMSHMKERRVAADILNNLRGAIDESDADVAEAAARIRLKQNRRDSFQKQPDTPLGVVLERKRNKKKRKR
jgi:hypothetical protein